jgi:hypothetical protein
VLTLFPNCKHAATAAHFCLRSDYNDSSVTPIDEANIQGEVIVDAAYLLFYLRRDRWPESWGGTAKYDAPMVPVDDAGVGSDEGGATSGGGAAFEC